MKSTDAPERFTLNLMFDVAAPNQAAARTKGLRISSDLVKHYELSSAPILKVQPARQSVAA